MSLPLGMRLFLIFVAVATSACASSTDSATGGAAVTVTAPATATGSGTVGSASGRIACTITYGTTSGTCTGSLAIGFTENIFLAPKVGSTLTAFTGPTTDCLSTTVCTVTPNGPTTISIAFGFAARQVVAGSWAGSCGSVEPDGSVFCWGGPRNTSTLGWPAAATSTPFTQGSGFQAASLAAPAGLPVALAVGDNHACYLGPNGSAFCFGPNDLGQLGNGAGGAGSSSWVPVSGGFLFRAIAAGGDATCAIVTVQGTLKCWGDGAVLASATPLASRSPATTPTDIAAGTAFTSVSVGYGANRGACGIRLADSSLACWGGIPRGDGTASPALTVTTVGAGTTWRSVSAGGGAICAVTTGGAAYCWSASGTDPVLAAATKVNGGLSPSPVTIGGSATLRSVSVGAEHACALLVDGTVRCWGRNTAQASGRTPAPSGMVGDGGAGDVTAPVAVATGTDSIRVLSAGAYHTCAISQFGAPRCWGAGFAGQLASGATADLKVPTLARAP